MSNMSSEAYVASFELFNSLHQQQQPHKSPIRILKSNLSNRNPLLPNQNIRLADFTSVVPGNGPVPSVISVHGQSLAISSCTVRSPDQKIFGTPVAIQLPKSTATFSNISNVTSASQLVAKPRKDTLCATITYNNNDSHYELNDDDWVRSVDSNGSDLDYDEITVIEEGSKANEEHNHKITNIATVSPQEIRRKKYSKPGHIKRPLNAFMAFSKIERRRIMDADPMMHHALVSKKLGASWKSLTSEQKKPYYDEAKQLADEHLRQYPGYKYKPKPKRLKAEEALKNATSPKLAAQIAATTARAAETARSVGNIKEEEYIKEEDLVNIKPAGRISPSSFHAWSLIYESEEEEDDNAEEMEDID